MPVTYDSIATVTLGTSQGTVTFSSIPQTFTDLVVVVVGANGGGSRVRYRFNGDTGSNYFRTSLTGNGSSANTYRGSNNTEADLNVIGGATSIAAPYTIITNLQNYSSTTTFKTLITRFGTNDASSPAVEATLNLWRSTSAITQIDVTALPNGNFVAGSTFTLYGIKAA